MPRQSSPDYTVDADRGSGTTASKLAAMISPIESADRAELRAGLRQLDAMTEALPTLSRQQRDRERILPREANAELAHPRMQRPMPSSTEVREPFSSRQKKARSKTRYSAQSALSQASYDAERRLVTDRGEWRRVNDGLSDHTGDVAELSEADATTVRRVDRAIQTYERRNDRGHVVYANVALPRFLNTSNLEGFCRNTFTTGSRITFDRYTAATHQLHETTGFVTPDARDRTAVFEIQTRRGAYLGGSDSQDNTRHLLPRGMSFEVAGTDEATYLKPDGTTGSRVVVQLRDVTPEPARAKEKP